MDEGGDMGHSSTWKFVLNVELVFSLFAWENTDQKNSEYGH